jgi:hypothetical protein
MSKNLTRKGLALGALVALTSTAFAGTPAAAAGEITVAPSAGTSYNMIAGAQFTLATTFAPGFAPAAYGQLKYLVKTDANSTVKFFADNATTTLAADVTAASAQAISTTSAALGGESTAASDISYLGLSAVSTTVSSSVEVTAFVDANNDGALTAGEWNTVKTVNFKKAADIVPVVSLTAPSTGDTTVKATVAWGDLNIEQISDETVKFTVGTQVASATAGTLAAGVWSMGSLTGLASAEAVTARAYVGTTALGSSASAAAAARTISDTVGLVANVVKGADATATAATTMVINTPATVRVNGSFTAQVKAFDRATTPAAKSGVAVVATVALGAGITLVPASTGVTEVSVTVAGTKYTSNTTLTAAKIALTTDASGLASVVVSSSGVASTGANTITVAFAAQNLSAAVIATPTAATYSVTDDASAPIRATNKNTAASFALSVKDQFGTLSARTNERVKVTTTQTGGTFAVQFINVVGGKASFSVTPFTDLTADVTVATALEISSYDAATGVTSWDTGGTDLVSRTIKVRSAAYSVTVDPAITHIAGNAYNASTNAVQAQTGTALADIALATLATGDTTWARVTFTGSNAGETLTVSGNDVILSLDGGAAAANTASVIAQGTVVVVHVASNKAGAKTLTISNGSVSKTVSVTFSAADDNAGSAIAISAPKTIKSGRTLLLTGTLTDKYGNPVAAIHGTNAVKLSVSYNGPGLVVGNLPSETNASGQFTVRVLLGSYDSGAAVLTAVYDNNTASTTVAEVTASTTTLVGISAGVRGDVKAVSSLVKGAEGLTVKIVRGSKVTTGVALSDSYRISLKGIKAGKRDVKVYVNDILVKSGTVTVR